VTHGDTPVCDLNSYAKDRGCTHPGCDVPGYLTEVHHVEEWATGGATNADKLTLACKPHHQLIDQGWKTRKLANGRTEWIPPPHLDTGTRTNNYHHPERLFDTDG
jgi:HNH endonuclease